MYDGTNVVLVFDDSSSLTHRYLQGNAVDQVFADETTSDVFWALADNQGTVRDIANYDPPNDATTVLNHRSFDSFGNITAESNGNIDFRYAYTGRYFDEDTRLQYNRARWYDPQVGRWISEDPIGFGGGDPNISRYVGNGPTNLIDPTGLDGDPPPLGTQTQSFTGTAPPPGYVLQGLQQILNSQHGSGWQVHANFGSIAAGVSGDGSTIRPTVGPTGGIGLPNVLAPTITATGAYGNNGSGAAGQLQIDTEHGGISYSGVGGLNFGNFNFGAGVEHNPGSGTTAQFNFMGQFSQEGRPSWLPPSMMPTNFGGIVQYVNGILGAGVQANFSGGAIVQALYYGNGTYNLTVEFQTRPLLDLFGVQPNTVTYQIIGNVRPFISTNGDSVSTFIYFDVTGFFESSRIPFRPPIRFIPLGNRP